MSCRYVVLLFLVASAGCGSSDGGDGSTGDPCVDRIVEDWNLQPVRPLFPGIEQDLAWLTAGTDKGVPSRLPATVVWPGEVVGGNGDGAKVYAPMELGTLEFQLILEGCPNQSETFSIDVIPPSMPRIALGEIPTSGATSIAWSPDGTRYAATLQSSLVLYSADGQALDAVQGPFGKGITFSPDGTMIGVGLGSADAAPGDLHVGSPLLTIESDKLVPLTLWPNGQSSGAAFSTDSRYYYTAAATNVSNPYVMRLDLQTGGRDYLIKGGEGDRPPGPTQYLQIWEGMGWDGSQLFEPNTGMLFNMFLFNAGEGVIFPESNSALLTTGAGAYRWQLFPSVREALPEFISPGGALSYAISPDGSMTATIGGPMGTTVITPIPGTTGQGIIAETALDAAWSPDGSVLLLATASGILRFTPAEIVALLQGT